MGRLIKLKITKLDAENAMQASVIDVSGTSPETSVSPKMSFSIVTPPIYVFTESTQSKTDFSFIHLQRTLGAFNM
jgi:hypothetical protein